MNATKLLKPSPGLQVRHPDGRPLDPGGEIIELTAYWLRRVKAGDVVEEAPAKATGKAVPAKAETKAAGDGQTKRGE